MSFVVSILGLIAAIQVITAINPVHAVFFLVLVFTLTSVLSLSSSMEFSALVFLSVYVGAIAVLFLFVVSSLNIQPDSNERPLGNSPSLVGVAILFLFLSWSIGGAAGTITNPHTSDVVALMDRVSNSTTVGQVLYTIYSVQFLSAGLVLLVSSIGAVILTQSSNSGNLTPALRQQVHQQHSRDASCAIFNIH